MAEPSPLEIPEPVWKRWAEPVLLALLALVLNLAGNARTSLWDRDEPRYVGCTLEMKARGDWLMPTFNAEPRFHKPVLTYWLQMASTSLAGDTPFGARLVSVLAGVATVLLVWRLGRRMFDPRTGRMATLVLASAPIMVVESKLATTDAVLMLSVTLAFSALWELEQGESKRWALVFWVSMALSVLTKGPVGPGVVVAAGLVSALVGGPRAWWFRLRPKTGVPVFLAVVLPWYVAISIATKGEFLRVAIGFHVLTRMTRGLESHGGFPGYYVVTTLLSFYPWSCLIPAALLAAWFRRRSTKSVGFLTGWIVGPLIVLECVRTKLVHYYLPSISGCALLVAWLVFQVSDAKVNLRRWPLGRLAVGLVAGLGAASAVGLTAAGFVVQGPPRWAFLAMGLVLSGGTVVAVGRFHRGQTVRAAHVLAATWSVMMLAAGGWLLPAVEPYRLTPLVASKLGRLEKSERATTLLADFKPPGVVFGMGHPVASLDDRKTLFQVVEKGKTVVSALNDEELALVLKAPELKVDVRERVEGLDVETARVKELTLVVIRASGDPLPVALRSEQKTLVK